MEQLKKYIIIDHRFQKSVNLYLDLGDRDRINSYIPTHSSLLALKYYLKIFWESRQNMQRFLLVLMGKENPICCCCCWRF